MENNNIKRRALGRGLEELFTSEPIDYNKIEEKIITETPKEQITKVKLDELRSNPYQPRQNFDQTALEELAASIKEHGVFQPIIIKKSIKGYEIIAGERRVKASKLAGLTEIPAIIREFTDNEMMEIALLENLQRENLNSIEEAAAYKKLLENLNLTQEQLAERLGKSRSHITNMLGLLSLPKTTQDLISSKKISMGHARVLSKLDDEDKIVSIAKKIASDKMTVRDIEEMTKEGVDKRVKINRTPQTNEYKLVEDLLRDKLDTKVKIKDKKIIISFTSNPDLNRILEIIDVKE